MRRLAACLMLLLALTAPRHAGAVVSVPDTFTNWEFTGTCTLDCSGVGTGVLVLKNYPAGSQFGPANFVSFRYDSSFAHFISGGNWQLANVPPLLNSAQGAISGNPLTDYVEYLTFRDTSLPDHYFAFVATSNGAAGFLPEGGTAVAGTALGQIWCVAEGPAAQVNASINSRCTVFNTDLGAAFTFEQVPEPASLALLAVGLAGLGVARRRRG